MSERIGALLSLQHELWYSTYEKFKYMWAWLAFVLIWALSFAAERIGGANILVTWLFYLQIADVIFGTYASLTSRGKHHSTYRSDLGIRGIDKKLFTWLYIVIAHIGDSLMGNGNELRNAFLSFYVVHTFGSLLEIWVVLKWWCYQPLEKMLLGHVRGLEQWLADKVPLVGRRKNKDDKGGNNGDVS